jgi:hypothetical protein
MEKLSKEELKELGILTKIFVEDPDVPINPSTKINSIYETFNSIKEVDKYDPNASGNYIK